MSAEYSVGQILAHAKLIREREHPSICNDDAADMLEAYAERIEADEARCETCGGTGEVVALDGEWRGECRACKYRDDRPNPPAQAAQKGWSLFTGTIGGVHVGLHGTKESIEALDAFLATHPHSPDAADSGRADGERVAFDAWWANASAPQKWDADFAWQGWQARAALAAQPQSASSPVGVPDDDDMAQLKKAVEDWNEGEDTDVPGHALMRLAELGLLVADQFEVTKKGMDLLAAAPSPGESA